MSRRHKVHLEDEAEESGELNLVPYLDIITTLVIFLIFTFQVIIEFRVIELLPPAYQGPSANPSENPEKPPVTLTLVILKDRYRLVTSDPTLGTAEILLAGTEYDNRALGERLLQVKKSLTLGESLILTAAEDVEYKHIIAAMDAARSYEGELLFPDVLLAKADVGGG